MKNEIKHTMETAGWPEIVKIIKSKLDQVEIPENGSLEEIGQRYLAKTMASKAFDRALLELSAIEKEVIKREISYK